MSRSYIAVFLLSLGTAFAVDPSPFFLREPLPTPATLNAVTWFQGQWIAAGENDGRGNVFRTTNGISWAIARCNTTNVLRGIATDSARLICVGDAGQMFSSTDGATWVARTSGVTNTLQAVAFGGGEFVAVGGDFSTAVLLRSSNALTWSQQTFTNMVFTGVAYGSGVWVVMANTAYDRARILVSTNALDWNLQELLVFPGQNLVSVTYGSSGFVAVGDGYERNSPIAFSPDGSAWAMQSVSNSWYLYLSSVCWDGTRYVAAGRTLDGYPYVASMTRSDDGIHWSQPLTLRGTKQINGISVSPDALVAVGLAGSSIFSVDGGTSWAQRGTSNTFPLRGIIYAEGKFTAVGLGHSGIVRQSIDGKTWGEVTLASDDWDRSLYDLVFANGLYVGVGGTDGGDIQTSTNGTDWTLQSKICCGFASVTYGPQGFVAVGANYLGFSASIATSLDGFAWTNRSSGLTNDSTYFRYLNAVTYGNGLYVAVGMSGSIVTSQNATNWTKRSTARASYSLHDILFTNGTFLAVGDSGIVLTSSDGTFWVPSATGISDTLNAVAYANGTYVAVGLGGAIATSTNGNSWTEVPSGTTFSLHDVTYGNGTFVAVGDWGVILQSQDFLRPQLQLVPKLVGFDLVVPPSELGRQYRIEAATVPTFAMPSTVLTYSGAYTNIVFRDDATNASRYYRVVSP